MLLRSTGRAKEDQRSVIIIVIGSSGRHAESDRSVGRTCFVFNDKWR